MGRLGRAFISQCAAGAPISIDGHPFNLSCAEADRAALDQLRSHEIARLSLAKDADARDAIRAEPYALKDVDGNLHQMTVGQAVDAIIAAGEIYKEWWVALAQKQAAVAAAQNVAAVNAIA